MANVLIDVERHAGVLADKMNRRAAAAVDNAVLDIVDNALFGGSSNNGEQRGWIREKEKLDKIDAARGKIRRSSSMSFGFPANFGRGLSLGVHSPFKRAATLERSVKFLISVAGCTLVVLCSGKVVARLRLGLVGGFCRRCGSG